jgi:two-component system OmpR family sensor kinase/two-component system sensor histidine kinase BaeS
MRRRPPHHHHRRHPPFRGGPYYWRGKYKRGWHDRRRFLFFRFAAIFGMVPIFVLGGMAVMAYLLTRAFGGDGQSAVLVWIAGCSLSLALPLMGIWLATHGFRDIARPLGDIMEAADAIAEGDFSVQVAEDSPGGFGRLGQSFNRMTGELARIDEQRRNLTADVAHELRTPLHIIQGNLEGILDGVYEATPEHIHATLAETRQLARLIDDLRTLSQAESGQLPLKREPISVAELLADVKTSFGGQAEAAGINLQVTVADAIISADVGRFHQMLGNLILNALRHTPEGGKITVRAEQQNEHLHLIVQDTGEGIPPEDLPHIFDRFWRGDRARVHADGVGGGLGLAITRQLVQLHDGRIRVESALGQGTIFQIDLPIIQNEKPRPQ